MLEEFDQGQSFSNQRTDPRDETCVMRISIKRRRGGLRVDASVSASALKHAIQRLNNQVIPPPAILEVLIAILGLEAE